VSALLLSYLSVTAVLVATPGATTAVVIQHTLRHGHRAGAAAACGAACGNTTYACAAGFGLAILFRQWPQALAALRIAGALYLCWSGLRALWRAWVASVASRDRLAADVEHAPAFRQGLTVTLLNPSVATFYLAVLPGFLPPAGGWRAFALLAAIHISLALSCHLIWALALGTVRSRLTSPRAMRAIDGVAGTALVILGVKLLR
jgi:threonine/homoserine/homoserine lactone efflux protein